MPTHPTKFIATIHQVREVSLTGHADLEFWRQYLAAENLAPIDNDGHAQILIVAATMRFRGIRFTEVSFSVAVTGGMFLIQAFISSRLFAFCERTFFATPYTFAHCTEVDPNSPAIEITNHGQTLLKARMADRTQPAAADPTKDWQGPIFLPTKSAAKPSTRKFFHGAIRGPAHTYPFVPNTHTLEITPHQTGNHALHSLIESHFTPTAWSTRPTATHARSKTYPREA